MQQCRLCNNESLFQTEVIGLLHLISGLLTAIIPMPWKVLAPSSVLTLWSTLPAMNWENWPGMYPGISFSWASAALTSNVLTSEYEEQKPWLFKVSIKNFDPKWWCICTPRPIWRGAINTRGRVAWTMAWPIEAIFKSLLFARNSFPR